MIHRPCLTRKKQIIGKSSNNSPILALIGGTIPCVFCLYTNTLLKVVNHYDLSVLSMSVMGFQNKQVWIEGWVGWWGEPYPVVFWIFFKLCKAADQDHNTIKK